MHAAQHAHFSSNRGKERFLKSCSQPVLHSLFPQTSVQRLAMIGGVLFGPVDRDMRVTRRVPL
jgi:hypothetical protein